MLSFHIYTFILLFTDQKKREDYIGVVGFTSLLFLLWALDIKAFKGILFSVIQLN